MEQISVSKFKATCLGLLEKIKTSGESCLITKKGKPLALVLPPPPPQKRIKFGCMKGTAKILGDIVTPLPEEDWEVLKN